MRAKLRLRQLTLSDGSVLELPEHGIVVVVGPNNSGKSQLLRDLEGKLLQHDITPIVVTDVQAEYLGTAEDLHRTLKDDRAIFSLGSGDQVSLGRGSFASVIDVKSAWASHGQYGMGSYFVTRADTETRLSASQPAEAVDAYVHPPSHPLHHVYIDREIENRLTEISRESFGYGVFLDAWTGGSKWALRIGDIDGPPSPRPSPEFLDAVRVSPLLHNQGDGVRSMLGLLLNFFTGHQTVGLIDEPEAFLHPPQARYLGRLLSDHASRTESLVIVSTHSSAFVHGVLGGEGPTTVVRLTREESVNHASVLDNARVAELWDDPLLRYSNLLEGLFAEGVVLCESDVDCRFFAAVLDTTVERQSSAARIPDVHFTSCGGKHRMHVAMRALRAASVPVAVIADFDVLNDWSVMSRMASAAGVELNALERGWRVLDAALRHEDRTPTVAGIREALIREIDAIDTSVPDKSDLERVRKVLRIENGWDRVKRTGLAGVPSGEAYSACVSVLNLLSSHGIHLVPVGEMEDILPQVGGHGSNWLAEVLEQNLHESELVTTARELVKAALASIAHHRAGEPSN